MVAAGGVRSRSGTGTADPPRTARVEATIEAGVAAFDPLNTSDFFAFADAD